MMKQEVTKKYDETIQLNKILSDQEYNIKLKEVNEAHKETIQKKDEDNTELRKEITILNTAGLEGEKERRLRENT